MLKGFGRRPFAGARSMKSIGQRIAEELRVAERQVVAAVRLIDGGDP
jgi:hypothetical protein